MFSSVQAVSESVGLSLNSLKFPVLSTVVVSHGLLSSSEETNENFMQPLVAKLNYHIYITQTMWIERLVDQEKDLMNET